jgi:hypothetical protein
MDGFVKLASQFGSNERGLSLKVLLSFPFLTLSEVMSEIGRVIDLDGVDMSLRRENVYRLQGQARFSAGFVKDIVLKRESITRQQHSLHHGWC